VVVVGAGVIGLSCAWRLALDGLATVVVDPEPGRGASWVAAGMLAPVNELRYGEQDLLTLNLAAAECWPAFAADLEADSGRAVGLRTEGTVLAAVDEGDAAWAAELLDFQHELGLTSEPVSVRRARQLEPALAPGLRAAVWTPGDHQVDNRRLLAALTSAVEAHGVEIRRRRVVEVEVEDGGVRGVVLEDGDALAAPTVVVAAGHDSGSLPGLGEPALPVRPVKGQILRLRGPARPPLLHHTVRAIVQGASVYVVPRDDGTVVVGATVEERGRDTSVTAGAVYELLRDARRVVPGLSELELEETIAGLRPGSPDNAPLIGTLPARPGGPDVAGLVVATGHFRNGILLAPITAAAVTGLVRGGDLPPELLPFSPARFAPAPGLAS
jgi:glycine oxidase